MKRVLTINYDDCSMAVALYKVEDPDLLEFYPVDKYITVLSAKDSGGDTEVALTAAEASQLYLALGKVLANTECQRICNRKGCYKKLAYIGARFCGAGCSARYEANE